MRLTALKSKEVDETGGCVCACFGRFDVACGRFDVAGLTGRSVHFWHFFAFPFRLSGGSGHFRRCGDLIPAKNGLIPHEPNIKISRNRVVSCGVTSP